MNAVISNSQKLKEGFEYIKDADTLRCPAGNLAIRKQYREECIKKDGVKRNATMEYSFDSKECKECPYKEKDKNNMSNENKDEPCDLALSLAGKVNTNAEIY